MGIVHLHFDGKDDEINEKDLEAALVAIDKIDGMTLRNRGFPFSLTIKTDFEQSAVQSRLKGEGVEPRTIEVALP